MDLAGEIEALRQQVVSLTAERDRFAAGPTWRDWQLTRERMAELQQERNELRANAPEEMIRLRRALGTCNARLQRVERERDELAAWKQRCETASCSSSSNG